MRIILEHPVGRNANTRTQFNLPGDVRLVQQFLRSSWIAENLSVSGIMNQDTEQAIRRFQACFMGSPDGVIVPGRITNRKMNQVARGKAIVVDLSRQRLKYMDGMREMGAYHCATGKDGHETPTGLFSVHRKHRQYFSRTYNNAPMHHAMFFYRGYAIHEALGVRATSFARVLGVTRWGSHGCVRLDQAHATALFRWTPMRTPVLVVN